MNKNICSICGKEYQGYGNNAQPVDDGRCCNDCNSRVVIPFRMYSGRLQEIKKNGGSEVLEIKSRIYNDVTFYYIKEERILTDNKKMLVKDITLKDLKSAINKLETLYYFYIYLICDYTYMNNLYREII